MSKHSLSHLPKTHQHPAAGKLHRLHMRAAGPGDCLHAVVRAEHGIDPGDLHGAHRQPEPPRDRLGGPLPAARRLSSCHPTSRPDRESVLPAVLLAEPRNALIVGHQRTGELDCSCDQESVRRVAVLEMMQPIAAAGGPVGQ